MWVRQSGDIILATLLQEANQIKSIYRCLLPESRPDCSNKEGKCFDHQSGLHLNSTGRAGKVISLALKPQVHASQINNPHHAPPQVTQTWEGRRAEEGERPGQNPILCLMVSLRVEEMRTRLPQPCLLF